MQTMSKVIKNSLKMLLDCSINFKIFLGGGMPPDPPRMSMLSVLCTPLCTYIIMSKYNQLYIGAILALFAPGPQISLGSPAGMLQSFKG